MEQTPTNESLEKVLKFLGIEANFESLENVEEDNDLNIEEDLGEFNAFLTLPDEEFKPLSELFFNELQLALNDSTTRYLLLTTIRNEGIDIPRIREQVGEAHELIDNLEDFSDLKKDFLHRLTNMVTTFVESGSIIGNEIINLYIELMSDEVKMPSYANEGDSGMDVYALDDFTINPGESMLIPTGLKVAIPNGYELQVRPKSGLSAKSSLRIANSPGTIDALYRDEVKVIVENNAAPIKDIDYSFDKNGKIIINSILHGAPIYISKGQKFAQIVLMKVPKATFTKVSSILNIEGNRGGGFGSTGL